jgi:sulfur-carrier protein
MEITVKLFATLQDWVPVGARENAFSLSLREGTTVAEVIQELKIPAEMKLIILVNSVHAGKDQVLHPGDVLALFPPIAGG